VPPDFAAPSPARPRALDEASALPVSWADVRAYFALRPFGRRLGGDLRPGPRSGLPPSPDRSCGCPDVLVPVTAFEGATMREAAPAVKRGRLGARGG